MFEDFWNKIRGTNFRELKKKERKKKG